MMSRAVPILRAALGAGAIAGMLALVACAPEDPGAQAPSVSRPSPLESETPDATGSPTPGATAGAVEIPTDCRSLYSQSVLSQLGATPLNDPAYGADAGAQPDGTLVCIWRDPGADVTGLSTEITRLNRGPALDLLNSLADEGFDCYTPSGGTRCERSETTGPDAQYPGIVQGRTLFWRDGILIDTRYANLAPTGYTDSIVQHLFN